MKIYKILDIKNESGKWVEEYEVPENFPIESGWTSISPSESLKFPKWEYTTGNWVEDKDSVISSLTIDNGKLQDRIDTLEGAILDLADMTLSR